MTSTAAPSTPPPPSPRPDSSPSPPPSSLGETSYIEDEYFYNQDQTEEDGDYSVRLALAQEQSLILGEVKLHTAKFLNNFAPTGSAVDLENLTPILKNLPANISASLEFSVSLPQPKLFKSTSVAFNRLQKKTQHLHQATVELQEFLDEGGLVANDEEENNIDHAKNLVAVTEIWCTFLHEQLILHQKQLRVLEQLVNLEKYLLRMKVPPDLNLLRLENRLNPSSDKVSAMREISDQFQKKYEKQVGAWRILQGQFDKLTSDVQEENNYPVGSVQCGLNQLVDKVRSVDHLRPQHDIHSDAEKVTEHLASILTNLESLAPAPRSAAPHSRQDSLAPVNSQASRLIQTCGRKESAVSAALEDHLSTVDYNNQTTAAGTEFSSSLFALQNSVQTLQRQLSTVASFLSNYEASPDCNHDLLCQLHEAEEKMEVLWSLASSKVLESQALSKKQQQFTDNLVRGQKHLRPLSPPSLRSDQLDPVSFSSWKVKFDRFTVNIADPTHKLDLLHEAVKDNAEVRAKLENCVGTDEAFEILHRNYCNRNILGPQVITKLEAMPYCKSSEDEVNLIENYFSTLSQINALQMQITDLGLSTLLKLSDKLRYDSKKRYTQLRLEEDHNLLPLDQQFAEFGKFLKKLMTINQEMNFTARMSRMGAGKDAPKKNPPSKLPSNNSDQSCPPPRPGRHGGGGGGGGGGGSHKKGAGRGGAGPGAQPPHVQTKPPREKKLPNCHWCKISGHSIYLCDTWKKLLQADNVNLYNQFERRRLCLLCLQPLENDEGGKHRCRKTYEVLNRKTQKKETRHNACQKRCVWKEQEISGRLCWCAAARAKENPVINANSSMEQLLASSSSQPILVNNRVLGSAIRMSEILTTVDQDGKEHNFPLLYDGGTATTMNCPHRGPPAACASFDLDEEYQLLTDNKLSDVAAVLNEFKVATSGVLIQSINGDDSNHDIAPVYRYLDVPSHWQEPYQLAPKVMVTATRHVLTVGLDLYEAFPIIVAVHNNLVLAFSKLSHRYFIFTTGDTLDQHRHESYSHSTVQSDGRLFPSSEPQSPGQSVPRCSTTSTSTTVSPPTSSTMTLGWANSWTKLPPICSVSADTTCYTTYSPTPATTNPHQLVTVPVSQQQQQEFSDEEVDMLENALAAEVERADFFQEQQEEEEERQLRQQQQQQEKQQQQPQPAAVPVVSDPGRGPAPVYEPGRRQGGGDMPTESQDRGAQGRSQHGRYEAGPSTATTATRRLPGSKQTRQLYDVNKSNSAIYSDIFDRLSCGQLSESIQNYSKNTAFLHYLRTDGSGKNMDYRHSNFLFENDLSSLLPLVSQRRRCGRCRECKLCSTSRAVQSYEESQELLAYQKEMTFDKKLKRYFTNFLFVDPAKTGVSVDDLPCQRGMSERRYLNIEQRLARTCDIATIKECSETVDSRFATGEYRWHSDLKTEFIDWEKHQAFYHPWLFVFRSDSKHSTKIRPCLDPSSKHSKHKNHSFNTLMCQGGSLNTRIFESIVMIRGRRHVAGGDVRKFFNQIYLKLPSIKRSSFLWRRGGLLSQSPLEPASSMVLTFGFRAAPTIAGASMEDNLATHSSIPSLRDGSQLAKYCDDIFPVSSSIRGLYEKILDLHHSLAEASFEIKKWNIPDNSVDFAEPLFKKMIEVGVPLSEDLVQRFNHHQETLGQTGESVTYPPLVTLRQHFGGDTSLADNVFVQSEEDESIQGALGLDWSMHHDTMAGTLNMNTSPKQNGMKSGEKITLANLDTYFLENKLVTAGGLSISRSRFHPLGLTSPVDFSLKFLHKKQIVMHPQSGWRDPVVPELVEEWKSAIRECLLADRWATRRSWCPPDDTAYHQPHLVTFTDASGAGSCFCIYLAYEARDLSHHDVQLIYSKSFVSSTRAPTMPAAESQIFLAGAVAADTLKNCEGFPQIRSTLQISDSRTSLLALRRPPCLYERATASRLDKTQGLVEIMNCMWSPSQFCAADLGSRPGVTHRQNASNFWFKGVFLSLPRTRWVMFDPASDQVDKHLNVQEHLPYDLRCPDPERVVLDPSLGPVLQIANNSVQAILVKREKRAPVTTSSSTSTRAIPALLTWEKECLARSNLGCEGELYDHNVALLPSNKTTILRRKNQPHDLREPFSPLLRSYKLSKVLRILSYCVKFFRMLRDRKSLEEVSRDSAEIHQDVLLQLQRHSARITASYLRRRKYKNSEMVRYDPVDELYYLVSRFINRGERSPVHQKWQILTVLQSDFTKSCLWDLHCQFHMFDIATVWRQYNTIYATPYGQEALAAFWEHCAFCIRCRQETQIVPMGALPIERLQHSPIFSHIVIDLTGVIITQSPKSLAAVPFTHNKRQKKRDTQYVRRYVMVIVCFSTQAVALQPVDSLDTTAMILALSAHFATRGRPQLVCSDLQKSFVSANKVLAQLANEPILQEDDPAHDHLRQLSRKTQIDFNTYLGQSNVRTSTPAAYSPHLQALAERKMLPVKSIVQHRYSHHCETDASFGHHCALTAEYINSVPHSIDRQSNTFFTRQQVLVSLPHRPGSLDVDVNNPLLAHFRMQDQSRKRFYRLLQLNYLDKTISWRKWKPTDRGRPYQIGDCVWLKDKFHKRELSFGIALVSGIKKSVDGEHRIVQVKYKRYFDSNYRFTYRHAHALVLLVPVGEELNVIPDFLAAGPAQIHLLDELAQQDPAALPDDDQDEDEGADDRDESSDDQEEGANGDPEASDDNHDGGGDRADQDPRDEPEEGEPPLEDEDGRLSPRLQDDGDLVLRDVRTWPDLQRHFHRQGGISQPDDDTRLPPTHGFDASHQRWEEPAEEDHSTFPQAVGLDPVTNRWINMSPGRSNVTQRVDFIISPPTFSQDRKTLFPENSFLKYWNNIFPKNTTGCFKKLWSVLFLLFTLLYLCTSCQAHDEPDCDDAPLRWSKVGMKKLFTDFSAAVAWCQERRERAKERPLFLQNRPVIMDATYATSLGSTITTYQAAVNLCVRINLQPISFTSSHRYQVKAWYTAMGFSGIAIALKTDADSPNLYWLRDGTISRFGTALAATDLDTAAERKAYHFLAYSCCKPDGGDVGATLSATLDPTKPLVCTAADLESQNWMKVPHRAADTLLTFNDFTEHVTLFQEIISSLENQTVSPYQHCPGREVSLLDVNYSPLPSTDIVMTNQEDILRNLQTWKTLRRNLVATLPQLKTASRLVKFRPPYRTWTYLASRSYWQNLQEGSFLEVFFFCISSLFVTTFFLCLLACICCRRTGLQPCCQGFLTCFLVPCQVLRTWRQPTTIGTLLPSNSLAMRPLETGRKKRQAPTPPATGFFSSLLPSKNTHHSTNVTVRMSPSTTRRLIHATQQDSRPKRTRALEGRFEEL